MGLKTIGAIMVGAAVVLATWPVDAATTTTKRKPTRVTVTKRSYLNAGTEVKPGDRHYTDYITPRNWSPYSYFDPSGQHRSPLPDPFWLPGSVGSFGY